MPKIEQIDWSKLKPATPERKSFDDGNSSLKRKKKPELLVVPPLQFTPSPIKTNLPHPFKCSRCKFVGQSKPDFDEHWSLEH